MGQIRKVIISAACGIAAGGAVQEFAPTSRDLARQQNQYLACVGKLTVDAAKHCGEQPVAFSTKKPLSEREMDQLDDSNIGGSLAAGLFVGGILFALLNNGEPRRKLVGLKTSDAAVVEADPAKPSIESQEAA
jgi:hypothetical protein